MDVLRLLSILAGAILGLAIGMNSGRLAWPQVMRLMAERISRLVWRIKDKRGIKGAPGEDERAKGDDETHDPSGC